MKHITSHDIEKMEKIFRLNLINSSTGYKSANLIATKSKSGNPNVAVFSSVTHMGSNPAMLGFVTRPLSVWLQKRLFFFIHNLVFLKITCSLSASLLMKL